MFSIALRSRVMDSLPTEQYRSICLFDIIELECILVALKRSDWMFRAVVTRWRMSALVSVGRDDDSLPKLTGRTSIWMSIRSSSGPEILFM